MMKLVRTKKQNILLLVLLGASGLGLFLVCTSYHRAIDGSGERLRAIRRANCGASPLQAVARPDYVLAFSYMDQVTWGARRVRGLQCWACGLQRDVRVVEPFVRNGSFLGLPPEPSSGANPVFGDIVDLDRWNERGESFGRLARWEEFLRYAPRYTILVQIVYEKSAKCSDELLKEHQECDLERVKRYWSRAMAPHSFTVIKELCIKFQTKSDFMTVSKFNQLIFANIPRELGVTLVFNEYRGNLMTVPQSKGETTCLLHIRDSSCAADSDGMHELIIHSMKPPPHLFKMAEAYTLKYLNTRSDYIAVMVRWELIFNHHIWYNGPHYHGRDCPKLIKAHLGKLSREIGLQSVFLATDGGRYGSSALKVMEGDDGQPLEVLASQLTETILESLYGRPITLEEYEKRFVEISGSTNPGFISQLHKAIAARARCLLIVGWSTFHESAVETYKELHSNTSLCFTNIPLC